MTAWTAMGRPIPFPEGQIAPPATAHAGSAPSLHGRELSPRVLECLYCAHREPADLCFTWSWNEQRFVAVCNDRVFCELRERGLPV